MSPYALEILLSFTFLTTAVAKIAAAQKIAAHSSIRFLLSDIIVLALIYICFDIILRKFPRPLCTRLTLLLTGLVATWAVINAAWIARTGTQALPTAMLPLFRSPANTLALIGVNLIKMPATAVMLLTPSMLLLAFWIHLLIKPINNRPKKLPAKKIITLTIFICLAAVLKFSGTKLLPANITAAGLSYNSHLRALIPTSPRSKLDFSADSGPLKPSLPLVSEFEPQTLKKNPNIVIIILEGIQRQYTSLQDNDYDTTPNLKALTTQSLELTQARSVVTHTTKAIFSLLTGFYPSVTQDLAETVPLDEPILSLPSMLRKTANYKTAFFQSAKGDFEARPGLVHNLGFDHFYAREDFADPNKYIGYLGCDEFAMINPILKWINTDNSPYLLTVLCSVSHDPYEVPEWFCQPAEEPFGRYLQTIRYTDAFIGKLKAKISEQNPNDPIIFCVVGDHGEAFGEHGLSGHERIAFEEALQIPCIIYNSQNPKPKVCSLPASSVDLVPTITQMLDINAVNIPYAGQNMLENVPENRKVFFSGWLSQGPAGYIQNSRKCVFYPVEKMVSIYNLTSDPTEANPLSRPLKNATSIANTINNWRKSTYLAIPQQKRGETLLYNNWKCRWNNRVSDAKRVKAD